MWNKFKNFISRDVSNTNEVKMYAVIMRLLLITYSIYSIVGLIACFMYGQIEMGIAYILVCMLCISFFISTYYNGAKYASIGTWLMFCGVMLLHSIYYGVNTGVFQIIYVQLLMIFVLDYFKKNWMKFILTAVVFIYRIFLYSFYVSRNPVYSDKLEAHWQAVHMLTYAVMVIFVAIISTADFSEMRKKLQNTNSQLRDVAGRDPLTGMYNRRSMQQYLEKQIQDFSTGEIGAITLVMADVDHFKNINDTYGHDNGDEVLQVLANIMGVFMRSKGMPSRWGGEEFVLAFINHNGDETYQLLCELQQEIAAQKFLFNGDEVRITLTYGVSEFGSGDNIDGCIKEADSKLYMGKEQGRNRIMY